MEPTHKLRVEMLKIILNKFKTFWETWDLRLFILFSLSMQAFLVLFAGFRKRWAHRWVIMLVWSAYLLANWVAAVTVGLISNIQGCSSGRREANGDLLAIWASFLLLHLGGPDNITSFSQEDNELWLRHLIGLILQVGAAIHIFVQSFPGNKLWLPTTLVLVAGTIKYAERTRAMFVASFVNFGNSASRKPNPGPEYERVQQMYNAMRLNHLPARAQVVRGPDERHQSIKYKALEELKNLDEKSLLRYAFGFFETFKGLIPGLLLSSQDRQASRDFFLNRTAKDAFKLIEIELSLLYEVLHTKVAVVQCWAGCIFRFISSVSVVVALVVFSFVGKRGLDKFDVQLTYVLFIGALILEAISVIKLMFLDSTVTSLESHWCKFIASKIIENRRWSESFYQCNFMVYCLKHFPKWTTTLARLFQAGSLLDKLKMMQSLSPAEHFNGELKDFIFKELREKSLLASNASEIGKICSSRGEWALQHSNLCSDDKFKWSVQEVEYAESLILWHIATELRFNVVQEEQQQPTMDHKKLSKVLSDYAFYLVVMQPTIMAPVSGNWQMVFQDTSAEAERFFRKFADLTHSKACEEILRINSDIKPGAVKGDVSKSVLFDACRLAKQLSELGEQKQWELMSKVWLEMLCYAAVHCRANVHAQQPSKGGELLTFIWLLMNHLGLGIQFYEANAARIKFIVSK